MQIIRHRCNTIEKLTETPHHYGVEIDLRSRGNALILAHDPYSSKFVSFDDWLVHYNHAFLILNVKEEGLEERLETLLKEKNIGSFFYLDQSFPFLIKTVKRGETRVALRISEYESIETLFQFARAFPPKKTTWVWVDCFHRFWLNETHLFQMQQHGFRVCLVSPELQGRPEQEIHQIRRSLSTWQSSIDAVCTKNPSLWHQEVLV